MKPVTLIFALCALLCGRAAPAAVNYTDSNPAFLSSFGLVQNVQNYSSNPFWDPNGPYNQRMPTPVYVQGTDLNAADCQRTVATLIASYCVQNNNCVGMSISDVRPVMMLQLSRLPGHNYASACGGYIDSELQSYVSKYATAGPRNYGTAFPVGTVPSPTTGDTEFKIENPYEIQYKTWNGEPWKQQSVDRENELLDLQSQNGAGNERLARANFPTTAADLSFAERMNNKATGYEKYKDAKVYKSLNLEDENEYRRREMDRQKDEIKLAAMRAQAQAKKELSHDEYCKKYPSDSDCKTTATAGTGDSVVSNENPQQPQRPQIIDGQMSGDYFDEEYDV